MSFSTGFSIQKNGSLPVLQKHHRPSLFDPSSPLSGDRSSTTAISNRGDEPSGDRRSTTAICEPAPPFAYVIPFPTNVYRAAVASPHGRTSRYYPVPSLI
nr:hypothetical protein Iba_chr14cCG0910 [Ipomoea batatas]